MPPEIKTGEADILQASLELVREQGLEALTARALALRLHCSVQPIFRCFTNMDALKAAVTERILQQYNQALFEALNQETGGFAGMGAAYIHFAQTEPRFFQLLFMSDAFGSGKLAAVAGSTEGDDEVIALLCRDTGLSAELAQLLYTSLWLTTHGIATMLATNSLQMSEEEIRRLLKYNYEGLIYAMKKEMK